MIIDKDFHNRLREQYNPDGSTLRKAQLRMVELLKFIDKICTENGINYWISFGTLIGAVRHEDFIPWDDDTDICMPLDDLIRFKHIMIHNNPSDEFVLQCHETDKGYCRSQWVVLRDLKSEYIQNSNFHNRLKYRGLQVDIIPVEYNLSLPCKKWTDYIQEKFISKPIFSDRWYYKAILPFQGVIWKLLNNIIIPCCRKYANNSNTANTLCVSYGVTIPYIYIGKECDIFPLKRIKFANTYFNAPCHYEKYLSDLYGKYEIVPDRNNIRTHDVKIRFIK